MLAQTEPFELHNIGYHDALGMMMWLMSHADYHSQWPLWSVDTDVVPALIHGQSKLYFDEHRNPVGFATWAWLNDEAKTQAIENSEPLTTKQWGSGKHLMFSDFVAPWGHSRAILGDLRGHVFPTHRAFSLGRHDDGSIRKIYYWKGMQFEERISGEQRAMNKMLWTEQA